MHVDNFVDFRAVFSDSLLDNPLAQKQIIAQSDLRHHQMLLLEEGHCLRGQALQICQLNNLEEQQDVRATGLETLRQMVRAGTGITFMPKIAIHEEEQGICYRPFEKPAPTRTIGLVWRKTSARKQLMEQLIDLITEIVIV